MKNEDKIVEILAESLKKLDQHSELFIKFGLTLEKQSGILEKQGLILESLLIGQGQLTNEIVNLRGDFHKMNDHH